MAFMDWRDAYSVGIGAMDAQHQKIIGLINLLADAMQEGKGNQVLGPVMTELVAYTQTHFAAEEQLMARHGYLELTTHKIEHRNLTQQVIAFEKQFAEGKIALSITLMNFLRDWLTGHIQGSDQRYGIFLNKQGVF